MTSPHIIQTADGSHSILDSRTQQTYHSHHGAIQESDHVFIQNGLLHYAQTMPLRPIHILEVGFGTGLNAVLTALYTEGLPHIYYTASEPYPLNNDIIKQLNYPTQLPESTRLFEGIHQASWEKQTAIHPTVTLLKTQTPFQKCAKQAYDIIYFDAFSPDVEPDLWTQESLNWAHELLAPNGLWVSYCAKGIVKSRLRTAGFNVTRCPGPKGKWHMLRARKQR